jgi:hypothetical protein
MTDTNSFENTDFTSWVISASKLFSLGPGVGGGGGGDWPSGYTQFVFELKTTSWKLCKNYVMKIM